MSGKLDENQIAKKRLKLLGSIIESAVQEAHNLGYSGDEIKKVFQEEIRKWFSENGK